MTILLYDLVGTDPERPFSPHCWKVAMALAHKGLSFQSVPTTFTAVPGVENGASKTVPVIRDGERVIPDSFTIATYLEDAYPDKPTLFNGMGGVAMARFVERWSQMTLHPWLGRVCLMDIHDRLAPEDQAHFRRTREARFGRPLEDVAAQAWEASEFRALLEPLRSMLSYQPYIGGGSPLFADYIVFGPLQWVRIMSTKRFLEEDDPVQEWFERCLNLHRRVGARVRAAAA